MGATIEIEKSGDYIFGYSSISGKNLEKIVTRGNFEVRGVRTLNFPSAVRQVVSTKLQGDGSKDDIFILLVNGDLLKVNFSELYVKHNIKRNRSLVLPCLILPFQNKKI